MVTKDGLNPVVPREKLFPSGTTFIFTVDNYCKYLTGFPYTHECYHFEP